MLVRGLPKAGFAAVVLGHCCTGNKGSERREETVSLKEVNCQ